MKCPDTIEMEAPPAPLGNQVKLPLGILGFEKIKDYVLLADPAEAPFAWLRVADNAALAFVVINPFAIMPDYAPNIPEADVLFLGLKESSDAVLLNIVTIHGPNHATVNLKGPIVINRTTHIAKQVIIANAGEYSVQHPIPVAEVAA
jgi:flagellar assembly factor FliW